MAKTKIKSNIEFGRMYRDKVSGFEGKAVCISKWQYGCVRVNLQPRTNEKGELPELQAFDENSLEGVEPIQKKPGGPTPGPSRNPDPKRY